MVCPNRWSQEKGELMGLFGKLVKTVVNVAELPLAVAKDVITLGGIVQDRTTTHTRELIEKIKEDADD